jgi:hypothetical protein
MPALSKVLTITEDAQLLDLSIFDRIEHLRSSRLPGPIFGSAGRPYLASGVHLYCIWLVALRDVR